MQDSPLEYEVDDAEGVIMFIDVVSEPRAVQGHRTSDLAACKLSCKQDSVIAAVRLKQAGVIVCSLAQDGYSSRG